MPIGGLKEKLLAAMRGGLKKVLIPEENAKDLVDLPASVREGLEIVPVARMEDVLKHALLRQPTPKAEVVTVVLPSAPEIAATSANLAH